MQYFNLLRFATGILIMVLLAKSNLTQSEVAIYEMFWFIVGMLSFFWVSASINAALSYLPKLDETFQKRLLFNLFLLFTGVSVVVSVLFYLFSDWFVQTLGIEKELPVLSLLCIFAAILTPTWLIQIFYLLLKKYQSIFVYGTLAFGLQICAVVLPLLLGKGLTEIFYGLIAVAVFRFLWLLVLVVRYTSPSFDLHLMRPLFLLSLPLVLKAFLGRAYEYADGFIVTSYFSESEFVIFRYGAKEMPYLALFIGAIVTAMLPVAARNLPESMQTLKEKVRNIVWWMFPLSAVLMFVSPWVFVKVFNPEFRDSAYIFNIYLLMLSSQVLLPQVLIMAKEKNWFLLITAATELFINVTLSLIFVRYWGLSGIAFASVVAFFVNKLMQIVYLNTYYSIKPQDYIPLRQVVLLTILLYTAFLSSLWLG